MPGELPEQAGGSEGGARPPAALAAAGRVKLLPGTAEGPAHPSAAKPTPKLRNTNQNAYIK